jgi:hypothetical protein
MKFDERDSTCLSGSKIVRLQRAGRMSRNNLPHPCQSYIRLLDARKDDSHQAGRSSTGRQEAATAVAALMMHSKASE